MATEFLAASVLNEKQIVTYRLLSRELKCHARESKRLLEEFYKSNQDAVHAVYTVIGTKPPIGGIPSPVTSGEDDGMSVDESIDGNGNEQIPVAIVKIVPQENLEKFKKTLVSVHSVEIYSLGPRPGAILEAISAVNRKVRLLDVKLSDSKMLHTYGVIPNPWIKKRELKVPPMTAKPAPKPQPKSATTNISSSQSKPPSSQTKSESKSKGSQPGAKPKVEIKDMFKQSSSQGEKSKQAPVKKAPPKGSIMAKFSQAQAEHDARREREKKAAPSDEEDDGETEADLDSFLIKRKQPQSSRPAKQDSPDIMDVDEEPAESDQEEEVVEDEDIDMDRNLEFAPATEPAEAEDEAEDPSEEREQQQQPVVVQSGGRRRGRRRVTKKVRVKDEDGFLVTREEQVWESFSESDAETPASQQVPPAKSGGGGGGSQPSSQSGRGGKTGGDGKKAQGSILTFFQKK